MAHVDDVQTMAEMGSAAGRAAGMMEMGSGMMEMGPEMKAMGSGMMGMGRETAKGAGMMGMGAGMMDMGGGMMGMGRQVASNPANPGRHLVTRLLGNPWVLFGLGVAAGVLIYKYRKEIVGASLWATAKNASDEHEADQ